MVNLNPAQMAARRPGEKASNFSLTCSRLSQYLKEKGGFGDLGLGISAAAAAPLVDGRGRPEPLRTMNLLPGVEAAGRDDVPAADEDAGFDGRKDPHLSMDLFPQHPGAGFGTSGEKKPDLISVPEGAQMTIFYGGKVVVLDNFPADKARELMAMAGRSCPAPSQLLPAAPQRPSCFPPAADNSVPTAAPASTCEAKSAGAARTPEVPATHDAPPQKPSRPAGLVSGLPIARRVSLHRFLEKRKDRISARAPYPVNSSPPAPPAKPEEKRQWLALNVSRPGDLHA